MWGGTLPGGEKSQCTPSSVYNTGMASHEVSCGPVCMHTTTWVQWRPMDEAIDGDGSKTIDKDGQEKAETTFLGRHYVSQCLSYDCIHCVRLHTVHAYP